MISLSMLRENTSKISAICHLCQNILSVMAVLQDVVTIVTVVSLHFYYIEEKNYIPIKYGL